MNRRGFLSFIGVSSAAPAVALAAGEERGRYGFWHTQRCGNAYCGEELTQFVDLSGPVKVGNQCPKCLHVMDLQELGSRILERQKR